MQTISIEERRRRLGRRHHLAQTAEGVERIAADLVGLHSSDPVTVYLSAWARIDGLTPADVDQALYDDRSVVRMLGMRHTLFVVPVDVAAAMEAGCTQGYAPAERRRLLGFVEDQLVEDGAAVWLEDVLEKTMRALQARGEATARELVEDVPELASKLVFGQGTFGLSTRVLFLLATSGRIVRARPLGTFRSSQYRWTPVENWLPGGLSVLQMTGRLDDDAQLSAQPFGQPVTRTLSGSSARPSQACPLVHSRPRCRAFSRFRQAQPM